MGRRMEFLSLDGCQTVAGKPPRVCVCGDNEDIPPESVNRYRVVIPTVGSLDQKHWRHPETAYKRELRSQVVLGI